MHIPPGGGPGPHRHDFEETFLVLEGDIEATFRGEKSTVHAGETINIPANAPHQFQNASSKPARLICICSPAGQEKFFLEVGVPASHRGVRPLRGPPRSTTRTIHAPDAGQAGRPSRVQAPVPAQPTSSSASTCAAWNGPAESSPTSRSCAVALSWRASKKRDVRARRPDR